MSVAFTRFSEGLLTILTALTGWSPSRTPKLAPVFAIEGSAFFASFPTALAMPELVWAVYCQETTGVLQKWGDVITIL